MTKPIDLIVANVMHECAEYRRLSLHIAGQQSKKDQKILEKAMQEQTARKLLCSISHDADLQFVMAALDVCKAPHTLELVGEGLQAIKDLQR